MFIAPKEVVVAHSQIEQAAGLDSRRIVVVILRARRRHLDERGPEL